MMQPSGLDRCYGANLVCGLRPEEVTSKLKQVGFRICEPVAPSFGQNRVNVSLLRYGRFDSEYLWS